MLPPARRASARTAGALRSTTTSDGGSRSNQSTHPVGPRLDGTAVADDVEIRWLTRGQHHLAGRDHGLTLEVDQLVVVLAKPEDLVGAPDLDDEAVLDRKGLRHGQRVVVSFDDRVDEQGDHGTARQRERASVTSGRPMSEAMRVWPMRAPSAR